jgi:hypothetical protein
MKKYKVINLGVVHMGVGIKIGDICTLHKDDGDGWPWMFNKNWADDGVWAINWERMQEVTIKIGGLLTGANLSRLSTALGKHRSYLNKLIQVGCSDKTYNKIKDKLTIDWNSDKPLYVNDGVHVPFTIKPISCKQEKHKEWLQSLMMKGYVKL